MFKFLREMPDLARGSVTPANHRYIQERTEECILRLKWFYRRAVHTVPNEHIIVQILRHAGVAYAGDDVLYYNSVRAGVNKIASALKINTDVHAMGPQPRNSFYHSDISEFIMGDAPEYPRGLDFSKHWMSATPITIRYHPYSDLSMNIPDGESPKIGKGYAIISVNIPLLMLQFTHWKKWTVGRYETPPSIQQFVMQYPVLNALTSHLECVWLNRMMHMADVAPNSEDRRRYGVTLPNFASQYDDDQRRMLDILERGQRSAVEVAQTIPMIFSRNVWDWVVPFNDTYTRQNGIYHFMAMYPYLGMCARISFAAGSKENNVLATTLQKMLREWDHARWFNQPGINAEGVKEDIAAKLIRYLVA